MCYRSCQITFKIIILSVRAAWTPKLPAVSLRYVLWKTLQFVFSNNPQKLPASEFCGFARGTNEKTISAHFGFDLCGRPRLFCSLVARTVTSQRETGWDKASFLSPSPAPHSSHSAGHELTATTAGSVSVPVSSGNTLLFSKVVKSLYKDLVVEEYSGRRMGCFFHLEGLWPVLGCGCTNQQMKSQIIVL